MKSFQINQRSHPYMPSKEKKDKEKKRGSDFVQKNHLRTIFGSSPQSTD